MKLHNYFRSSASFRVRIALALKGLPYDYVPVHLVKGEQGVPPFADHSPERLVPLLEVDGEHFSQSLAIIEYLDEAHPGQPLLPASPAERAHVRAIAQDIACEMHPVNNLRVLKFLTGTLGLSEEQKMQWYRHWVQVGFEAVERQLARHAGLFCFGDQVTLADLCLVPQVFNAQRFDCPLDAFPTVMRVHQHCMSLPAFQAAAPQACPDAQA